MRDLPDEAIDAFLDQRTEVSARLALNGGAIADVPAGASAYSHRDALVEFTTSAGWTDPTDDDHRITTVRNYAAALNPFATGSYVNTISDPDPTAVHRAYSPPDLTRLTTIKRRYDLTNVFHHTLNIRP